MAARIVDGVGWHGMEDNGLGEDNGGGKGRGRGGMTGGWQYWGRIRMSGRGSGCFAWQQNTVGM